MPVPPSVDTQNRPLIDEAGEGPYDPGAPSTWVKIRNPGYTQAEGRWELFAARRGEPQRRAGA